MTKKTVYRGPNKEVVEVKSEPKPKTEPKKKAK